MKRIILITVLFLCMTLSGSLCVNAVTLYQALNGSKPVVLLIYTSWSNYKSIYNNLKKIQPKYSNYNFSAVDLANKETELLFKDKSFAISDIPMVLLIKRGGKLSRLVSNSCAADYDCMIKEINRFGK